MVYCSENNSLTGNVPPQLSSLANLARLHACELAIPLPRFSVNRACDVCCVLRSRIGLFSNILTYICFVSWTQYSVDIPIVSNSLSGNIPTYIGDFTRLVELRLRK